MRLYRWTKAYQGNPAVCYLPDGQRPTAPTHWATGLPYVDETWTNTPSGYVEDARIYELAIGGYAIRLPLPHSDGATVPYELEEAVVVGALRLHAIEEG